MSDETGDRLGIVVVTYDSGAALPPLLASLARHEPAAVVVIVDSASPTGAPERTDVPVIAQSENRGYGAAANVGADWLRSHHANLTTLAFLNPDVRLGAASLTQLAAQLDARPGVGVASGPLVDSSGRRLPSAWGHESVLRRFWFATGWQAPRLRGLAGRISHRGPLTSSASLTSEDLAVDGFVRGGTMVVRVTCWRDLGGFDEGFFMFGEDMDLCARARAHGWEVRLLPCAPFTLDDRGSSADADTRARFTWYRQGARRYAQKHLDPRRARRLERALRWGYRLGQRP